MADRPLYKHPHPVHELGRRYRHYFALPGYRASFFLSVVMLVCAWFVNYFAILFATEHISNSVTDIVLSNIPIFQVDGLFVYGTFILAIFGFAVVLAHPKRIPFAFKTVALFWVIRSIFAALTHIAPFETQYVSNFGPTITHIFFGGDLFFSAHTGMPFLGVLAFWREKWLRLICIFGSLFFATIVLLGHLHYSIDVLSAFFITYGIFHIALFLFPKDSDLFYSSMPDGPPTV